MFLALTILSGLVIAAYYYLIWNFEYWKERGVLSPKPKILFGNLSDSSKRKCHATDDLTKIYNEYKNRANFVGIYQMRSPRVFVLEPKLAKEILISNFKSFKDNEFSRMFDSKNDPLFARNPFLSRGDDWKDRRTEVAPAFSSNRLRCLYPLIQNVCERLSTFIREELAHPLEARDLTAKYTTDVVSNCIFGIETNCLQKEDNELRKMSKRLFSPSGLTIAKVLLTMIVPQLKKLLKVQFIQDDVNDFFMNLIGQAVDYRTKNQISREDFLEYLVKKKGFSATDLAGHSITFFSDGLETSSITIAYTLYELAKNEAAQEKLRKEIEEITATGEEISFEVLQELPYLDQVLNESLRLHPPFTFISKECTDSCELEYTKGKTVKIEKGIDVYIPLYQFQRDAEYFPDPDKFIPERFDPQHGGVKAFRDKGVFLTFGDGPRFCLGMKFAMMQSKAAIVEIMRNFKISINAKTEKVLVIDPVEFMNVKRGGFWLDFKALK